MENKIEEISFGAGCFWGVELAFMRHEGVVSTNVGYQGGHTENPSYEAVCSGTTGHIEVVKVQYDNTKTSLNNLLELFWKIHNPTLVNQQGPDIGTQYQSAIFYNNEEQLEIIKEDIERLKSSGEYDKPISTFVKTGHPYFAAEEYHQKYLEKNPNGYCHIKGLLD